MKSKIALVVVSFWSKMIWFSRSSHWKVRYTTPLPSQWLGTYLPAQLIICVTLFATTNSWSWKGIAIKSKNSYVTYLSRKTVAYKQAIFDFNSTYHIFWHWLIHQFHLWLLVVYNLLSLVWVHFCSGFLLLLHHPLLLSHLLLFLY